MVSIYMEQNEPTFAPSFFGSFRSKKSLRIAAAIATATIVAVGIGISPASARTDAVPPQARVAAISIDTISEPGVATAKTTCAVTNFTQQFQLRAELMIKSRGSAESIAYSKWRNLSSFSGQTSKSLKKGTPVYAWVECQVRDASSGKI